MVRSKSKGSAITGMCPRGGYIRMTTKSGLVVTTETHCKTWSCISCRESTKRKVINRIRKGISILGECYFITLTLRLGEGETLKDAAFVQQAWRALLKRLSYRHPQLFQTMAWLKVTELTKKGQPHLHLIVGGFGRETDKKELTECFRDAWLRVTGDSYIVWVVKVTGEKGAAYYLCKYLTKGVMNREDMEARGFKRRWSSSANWPKGETQLLGTKMNAWETVEFVSKHHYGTESVKREAKNSVGHRYLETVGDSHILSYQKDLERDRILSIFKRMVNFD